MGIFHAKSRRVEPQVETQKNLTEDEAAKLYGDFESEKTKNVKAISKGKASKQKKSSNSETSSDTSSALSSAGSAAAAIAAAFLVLSSASNIKVTPNEVNMYGKSLDYDFSVVMEYEAEENALPNWSELDTGLYLIVSNSKESHSKLLNTADEGSEVMVTPKSDDEDNTKYIVEMRFRGNIEGLTEKRVYKLSVVGYEENGSPKVYYNDRLKTDNPVSAINSLEGYCTCLVDGKYHFKLSYIDEQEVYESITYRLRSPNGDVVMTGVITSSDEITMEGVDKLEGTDYQLEITILSKKQEDIEKENYQEELGPGTTLNINKGTIQLIQRIQF